VVAAPGVDLLNQTVEALKIQIPGREVVGIFTGARGKKVQSDDITVTSLDSLSKLDKEGTKLLLIDEPHSAVSESRAPELAAFKNARLYGYGASTSGRYDQADKLITGIIGPVLAKRTFREAVVEGAICNITVFMLRMQFDPTPIYSRDSAYQSLLYNNSDFNSLVQKLTDEIIPKDFQTIIFADEIRQISLINRLIDSGVQAVAKRMTPNERRALFAKMVSGEIKRCVSTEILSVGVTFPDLKVVVNACAGGSGIASTQKPGRLAQCRPGKISGFLVDFKWMATGYDLEDIQDSNFDRSSQQWSWLCKDSAARLESYNKLGYTVKEIDSIEEIKIE
jgi:superfamily II DNA or RNA helicase